MLNIDGLHEEERWLKLRDLEGRLWARYNPSAEILEFRRKDVLVRFELKSYREAAIREVGARQ